MQLPQNIERSATRKGEYVGYAGNGQAVRVRRHSHFGWEARTTTGRQICVWSTLTRMGAELAKLVHVTA